MRINGVLSRFQLRQHPSEPTTKFLAIVPKTFKLNDVREAIEKVNANRKVPFQFETLALPYEANVLRSAAEEMVDQANRMVYCPGTTNDAGSGCTPGTPPADFIKYIRQIYDFAVKFPGGANPNLRVMQWLRFQNPRYTVFTFNHLMGSVEDDWIKYVQAEAASAGIKIIDSVTDPKYAVKIKVSHFGASLNGFWSNGALTSTSANEGDVGGWGGDWITFYAEWQRDKINPGSRYCREFLAKPGDAGSFKLRDLIEDVDAYNVSSALLASTSRTIVDEIEDLFKPGGGYRTRFSRFTRRALRRIKQMLRQRRKICWSQAVLSVLLT